jgi:hypothetical protein
VKPDLVEVILERLRPLVAGRPVVLAGSQLAGGGSTLDHLRGLGCGPVLLIGPPGLAAQARAAGATFLPARVEGPDSTIVERRWDALVADPPAEMAAVIEAHDPDRQALVLLSPRSEATELAGRAVFGARRPAWVAMEDKLEADALWDAAGIERAPTTIVPCQLDALRQAADRLDEGLGTVWAGDASEGVHSEAHGVRWVRDQADAQAAVAAFAGHHRRVRVMPFLEGRPCGIHGMVLPDGVVALRPVEHVVVHTPTGGHIQEAGVSTVWEPSRPDWQSMRTVARRVGAALRDRVAFRSSFSIDGVLTADGFRATECNARWGGALNYLIAALPHLPLPLVHGAVADGIPLGVTATALEERLLAAGVAQRRAIAFAGLAGPAPAQSFGLARTADGWERATADATTACSVEVSDYGGRGLVFVHFAADQLPSGRSTAPEVVSVLGWLNNHLGLGIGPLEAAPEKPADPR